MKPFRLFLVVATVITAALPGLHFLPSRPSGGVPALSAGSGPADVRSVRPPPVSSAEPLPEPPAEPATRPVDALEQLPPDEQASLHAAIHEARHAIEPLDDAFARFPQNRGVSHFAANPGQDITACFLEDGGVRFESGIPGETWQGTLRLAGAASTGEWKAEGTRVERDHGTLTEWYVNRADGIEHGFTVRERPADLPAEGPLVLRMAMEELRADPYPGREGDLIFTDTLEDRPVLAYRDLKVWDATGRELGARMRPAGDGFLIAVNDHGAQYPVTVDPLIVSLEQKLTPGEAIGNPVSSSLEGDVFAVGTGLGQVAIFVRGAGGWEMSARLKPPPGSDGNWFDDERFGASVAVRWGGETILVGSPGALVTVGEAAVTGVVHVYQQYGAGWVWAKALTYAGPLGFPGSQEPGAPVAGGFGSAVAVDTGSDVILVAAAPAPGGSGSPGVYAFQGVDDWNPRLVIPLTPPIHLAVDNGVGVITGGSFLRVYNNIGSSNAFTQFGPLPGGSGQERPVDISGDTIVMGNPSANYGSVRIYRRQGEVWSLGQTLTVSTAYRRFGTSVAVDGDTLLAASANHGVHRFRRGVDDQWSGTAIAAVSGTSPIYPSQVAVSGNHSAIAQTQRQPSVLFWKKQENGAWAADGTIITESGREGDAFGTSVGISGDLAVVGASGHDLIGASNSGAAWVFRREGTEWTLERKFMLGLPSPGQRFGISVAISGNWLAVGAPGDDTDGKTDCGSVSVFFRSSSGNWMSEARLTPAPSGARLGRSVDIEGPLVVAGAPGGVLTNPGSVWVFSQYFDLDWDAYWRAVERQGPNTNPPGFPTQFGHSVALSGNRVIVGVPGYDPSWSLDGRGMVAFYTLSGSGLQLGVAGDGSFHPSPGMVQGCGTSVALQGDVAVGGNSGSAFLFTRGEGGWVSTDPEFLDGDGLEEGLFGSSVAIEGDLIAVGARGGNNQAGAVRLFRKQEGEWVKLPADIHAPTEDGGNGDFFGSSVGLSGDTLLAGARGVQSAMGTAYVYRLTDSFFNPPQPLLSLDDGTLTLTWPAGTGLALWQSPSPAGPWTKVPGSGQATNHSAPVSAAPRMFFRLAPP